MNKILEIIKELDERSVAREPSIGDLWEAIRRIEALCGNLCYDCNKIVKRCNECNSYANPREVENDDT